MEQLLFLLLVGLIALVRWLFADGGLRKILENLEGDLGKQDQPSVRQTPVAPRQQPGGIPPAGLETEEERRRRKFMEALGLPTTNPQQPAPRRAILPVPPIVHQPTRRPSQTQVERTRLERKLEERRRALNRPPPVPMAPVKAEPEESHEVGRYFQLEKFNQPALEPVAVQLDSSIPTLDGPAKAERERVNPFFQGQSDLRRLVLAQEILGRPKSLQSA